ncbi:MAG: amidohydrolase family protein [Sneathiellaceae bacterium]
MSEPQDVSGGLDKTKTKYKNVEDVYKTGRKSMPNLVDINKLKPAEDVEFASPVPIQMISNGEFTPMPQTPKQRQVEERIKELADTHGRKQGLSRRRFLGTAAGLAAGFVAMNEVFGPVFKVSEAEAADREMADERAAALSGQFILDDQTHLVHDGFMQEGLLGLGLFAAENWNPALNPEELTLAYYKFDNYMRQMFVNSDTKIALLSGAPFDDPSWWMLPNDQIADTVAMVNKMAGTRRMLGHFVITPGQPGWMEAAEKAMQEGRHDGWKSYTIGDPLSPGSEFPYRLDDEKLMYPFYEKALKAGKRNIAVHKGLMPADYETSWAGKWEYNTAWDIAKAAKDWPEMNFIIYHSCMRPFLEPSNIMLDEFNATGELKWASDLARIPQEHGVSNVYAELGTTFANSCVTDPRLAAATLGILIKGMGVDHVVWGTDSVFYGSPQWQIEAMRRLEIPEDMQRKHGFAPLGAADGFVKNAIFGLNSARLFNINLRADLDPMFDDGISKLKRDFAELDGMRDNVRYGYVSPA